MNSQPVLVFQVNSHLPRNPTSTVSFLISPSLIFKIHSELVKKSKAKQISDLRLTPKYNFAHQI